MNSNEHRDANGTGALDVSTLSEVETKLERELPNGTTSQPTASPEELDKSRSRSEFIGRDFTGRSLDDLFIIELCAGSARLSKVAHQQGFRTMAVDQSAARSNAFPICIFDLTDSEDLKSLVNFIEEASDSILAIWIAPSCGTASRAREKRLKVLEKAGYKSPIPLRSTLQPDQLDGLAGLDKVKVECANMLYASVYDLASLACDLDIFVAIENPTNSHYWNTTPMVKLCRERAHHYVTFHNCAHGGDRDKSTSLWVNGSWLDSLAMLCDGKHQHKPWTTKLENGAIKFATAEEAAYPILLCERIVHCLRDQALQMGASSPQTIAEQTEQPASSHLSRLVLGALPRGHRLKPLVAEYGHYVTFFADPQRPEDVEAFVKRLPKGSKPVSRHVITWGDFQSAQQTMGAEDERIVLNVTPQTAVEKINVGVPSDSEQFLERAIAAGHPRSLEQYVDPQVKAMISANFLEEPADLAKRRIQFFKHYLRRASDLASEEERLRRGMPEHVRKLVGNKRLALWKEMLADYNYPDTTLIDDIASGFKLSEWMPKSGVFKKRAKRPSMSLATLKSLSKALNAATCRNMETRQEEDLEEATWNETEAEVSKGWVWLDEAKNSSETKFVGRRFGVKQSSKIRVIDDCSCCGLNWTVGLHEKFQLQSIDVLASMVAEAFKAFPGITFPRVLGRCYDLKSAYKQFAVHPRDRSHLRMAVRSTKDQEIKLLGFNALPFGAVGSVAGFLRVSLAVWFLGLVALKICWTVFYDDYSVLSRVELLENTSWSVETLFSLLGLTFAQDGKKFQPFDKKFKMLGLEIDLSSISSMNLEIGHTDERKMELVEKIDDILNEGWLESKEAERLRGRMVFYEGYTFGRIANAAIKNLSRFCLEKGGRSRLDDSIRSSLALLKDRVLNAPPTKIGRALTTTWIIFTDGACNPEEHTGSVGGLLISPSGICTLYFSEVVPGDFLEELFKLSKNPIHELEVLPVLLACSLWGHLYSGALVVYYIDNESARMAFIKGSGETPKASSMVHSFVCLEAERQHRVWFGRCPSHSNPSDSASRLQITWFERKGVSRTRVTWETLEHHPVLGGEKPER